MRDDPKLLIDGQEAFPEIIRCIRGAKNTIHINMFIWRDDEIGNQIAGEVLGAADRGVKVVITKDRYGVICETCEENQRSLFHANPNPGERIQIRTLIWLYNRDLWGRRIPAKQNERYRRLASHPNVRLIADRYRYDHSKYYLFDDSVLILGGINIEDKENGQDRAGRRYRDYMVEFRDRRVIERFLRKMETPHMACEPFAVNLKSPERVFEIEERYLRLINGARESLTILMAYFSPEKRFLDAIRAAAERGVAVRVVVPASANFTDATNKRTMKELAAYRGGGLELYLSGRMLHAKLVMSEKTIGMGSCNITKKAFFQLDELNCFLPNDEGAFAGAVRSSVEDTVCSAMRVTNLATLKHSRLLALLEGLLM